MKTSHSGPTAPSSWVAHFLDGVAPGARVLDVACGAGRHVRLAVGRGLSVTAIDRDIARLGNLAGNPNVEAIQADLEDGSPFPVAGQTFGGVVVTNYLWRPLLPAISATVAPDGVLIYETFAVGHERLGGKPSNPEFYCVRTSWSKPRSPPASPSSLSSRCARITPGRRSFSGSPPLVPRTLG